VPKGVDLNNVVVHSLKLLKGAMPPEIELELRLEGDVLLVHADETQLKQVVMNLCLNSRDAMDKGGKLTVATEKIRDHTGQDGAYGDTWVKLSVQDTGHGIDAAIQSRIFEPFFSTKERGTGLGLAVVRQIIESLGGRIEMTSHPNEGTRMEVFLQGFAE
jgi:two-component system cell cycle sensor histidine kinase/response regulator CckA